MVGRFVPIPGGNSAWSSMKNAGASKLGRLKAHVEDVEPARTVATPATTGAADAKGPNASGDSTT
jgi:hypothetical protein